MKPLTDLRTAGAFWLAVFGLVFATIAIPGARAQGVTTAGIGGFVTDKARNPVAGASVTVLHVPSGTRATTTSRANGQYSFSGLRIGGPYTVTVSSPTIATQETKDIFLDVSSNVDVSFTVSSDVVVLEAVGVSVERDLTFGTGKMGTGSSFDSDAIANTASVRNSVQDIARLDSRFFLGSLDQGGQLSAQGQNFRYNSFLIDGVQAGDPFGLNSNGFSSLGSPVPLESLETISIQLNPYDVRYAGFTGAVINAVVKSGTNRLRGSVYYQYTNENLRAKNPLNGRKEPFDEKNYGINVNGPIIRNKLFFSFSYDKQERETVPPQANFVPDATGIAQINSIIARATALRYDAGSLSGPSTNLTEQETYIGKLDWNISNAHRLSATYRRNYGQFANFANYSTALDTSLSNHWFDQPRNTESYTAQLNSQWNEKFSTEATYSYTEFDGTPVNRGAAFPMVRVLGISGKRLDTGATVTNGSIYFGTENSRQLNQITTEETQMKLSGDYNMGDHVLSFGGESVSTKYNNAFIQNTMGNYTFASTADWLAGTPPSNYILQQPYAGFTLKQAIADWAYDAYAVFVQDTWRPTAQLTLVAGLRYDLPKIDGKPPLASGVGNAGFRSENGRAITRNDTTNTNNATFGPRLGFTYELAEDRKTQIRGGIGLFQGKNPAVWLSNAYSNAGTVYNYTATAAERPLITFNPDPNTQRSPGSANPAPNLNITDEQFKQPALWKSNIAIDRELPFGGITLTAEYYHHLVESGVQTEFLNYLRATDGNGSGLAPDGRYRFGSAASVVNSTQGNVAGRRRVATFADVFYLTNTSKGVSRGFTLSLNRPMKNNWAWSLSWTNGHATEVSPITSSTASSNYSNRAVFNPNEDVASISNTNIQDTIVASYTRRFEFVSKAPTTVNLTYIARTGHPYSWVFYGDANGDGFTFNDLLYVPTGPTDPKVRWADATQRDAFFAFVESSSLKNYMGGSPGRNTETSPWLQTVDLKITQALPIFKSVRAELFANVLNFANLFNDSWGIQEEVPFSYRRAVAGATLDAAANGGQGAWNYVFNTTTLNGVPVTADDTPISRWQVQLGMRIKF
ncbi:MAG: TonB-dependent receptor [Opitutaceae bacterium]